MRFMYIVIIIFIIYLIYTLIYSTKLGNMMLLNDINTFVYIYSVKSMSTTNNRG